MVFAGGGPAITPPPLPPTSSVAVEDALLKGRGRGGTDDMAGDNLPPQDEALDKARGLIVNSGLSG